MNGCFRKPAGEAKNKPGASAERLQPWRELASHDLCQLAWIFRRHSWHVQRDLEVWSHDRGCVGGVQASHLYLHPQARWVAWWCLGGHWSGHQPWEDGDSAIQKGFALPRFLVFLELCPFELADVQLAASAIYARIPQNTPEYPRYTCPHQGSETTNYIRLLSIGYFIPLYPRGARFVWSILDHCYNVSIYTTVFRTPSTKYSLIFISHIYTLYIYYIAGLIPCSKAFGFQSIWKITDIYG